MITTTKVKLTIGAAALAVASLAGVGRVSAWPIHDVCWNGHTYHFNDDQEAAFDAFRLDHQGAVIGTCQATTTSSVPSTSAPPSSTTSPPTTQPSTTSTTVTDSSSSTSTVPASTSSTPSTVPVSLPSCVNGKPNPDLPDQGMVICGPADVSPTPSVDQPIVVPTPVDAVTTTTATTVKATAATVPAGPLPVTGSNTLNELLVAAGFAAAGGAVIVVTRRRKVHS